MPAPKTRQEYTHRRHLRVRKKVSGTTARPRLAVYRSGKHIYAQVIDDSQAVTLVAASSLDKDLRTEYKTGGTIDAAKAVGSLVAQRAKAKGIETIVFDRGGNIYHGRIQALAEAAREQGLVF